MRPCLCRLAGAGTGQCYLLQYCECQQQKLHGNTVSCWTLCVCQKCLDQAMQRPLLTAGKIQRRMLSGQMRRLQSFQTPPTHQLHSIVTAGQQRCQCGGAGGVGKEAPLACRAANPLLQRVSLQLNSLKSIKKKEQSEEVVSRIDIKIKEHSEAWFPELARVLNSAKGVRTFLSRKEQWGRVEGPSGLMLRRLQQHCTPRMGIWAHAGW